MNEKGCIIASMKKGIKENPTLKKYLDKMVSDGIDEDTALNIMILAWLNNMDFPEETGHLKKSTPQSQIDSIIKDRWINKKIEELRKLGYSDEYINKKLGHLVNWRI